MNVKRRTVTMLNESRSDDAIRTGSQLELQLYPGLPDNITPDNQIIYKGFSLPCLSSFSPDLHLITDNAGFWW